MINEFLMIFILILIIIGAKAIGTIYATTLGTIFDPEGIGRTILHQTPINFPFPETFHLLVN